MTITGQSSLPKDDISRMVKDAEEHAAEDKRRRAEAETRNEADSLVYQTEKILREQGDKVPDEKEKVEEALKAVKDALGGTDVDAIGRAVETLKAASQQMGQKIYEAAGAANAAAGGNTAPTASSDSGEGDGSDDEVVDAEIVDEPTTGTEGG